MKIYDITPPISSQLVVWEGDPAIELTHVSHLEHGDISTVTALRMGAHTGAHVDAPCHFVAGGASTESLDLQTLVGPALVVDVRGQTQITAAVLESLHLPAGRQRLLFLTDNSTRRLLADPVFHRDYVALTADAATWLVQYGLKLVGIDALSIAPYDQPQATHYILLQAGVIVVEGLSLQNIHPGAYELYCLPLPLVGSDGAPARAILIESD
ncbi:MAG: cyclase family protein [Chloroflexi bacterium]|nr:cyclase family protein [Chloroflexota bacterium]